MPNKFIPVTGPWITRKEISYVAQAAKDGWNENYSKYINLFEQKMAKYVGRKYALATSSCTAALHLSFIALGIGKGDEVIVPNATWIASVEPLSYVGAKIVLADIDPKTWCITAESIEKHISKKTKAILLVDLYGNMPDMKSIFNLAKKYNLRVIEDSAEAVGSEYFGKKAGSFGDISCFSFHGAKMLVTGEGGMLLTDDKNLFDKARYYYDHCKDPKKIFWNNSIGYKYKMSNFQAACGLAQLERIEQLLAKKRKIYSWYSKRLAKIDNISYNIEPIGTKNNFWMITVVIDKKIKKNKLELMEEFSIHNIQVRPFFYCLSELPPFKQKTDTPVSLDISKRAINLPCGLMITKKDVDRVCDVLEEILKDS